jgi:hypothetical protein
MVCKCETLAPQFTPLPATALINKGTKKEKEGIEE